MYLNKALIYGNLTRDPELKSLPSGQPVVSFSVATNRTWKDKNGVKQESVEFHPVVAFGRPAELIHQYLKKGQPVFVEGRISTRSWDDKATGEKRYRTEIILENFQFGPKHASGVSGFTDRSAGGKSSATSSTKEPELETIEYPDEDIDPNDIPF